MEQRIRARYSPAVLTALRERYRIGPDAIRLIDGFESFVFEFERPSGLGGSERGILRLSHNLRRTEGLILGEIDWINYLAAGGASVARAILSQLYAVIYRDFRIDGDDVSTIDDAWSAAYMRGRKARIESGAPYLDMDFEQLGPR